MVSLFITVLLSLDGTTYGDKGLDAVDVVEVLPAFGLTKTG